MKVKRVYGALNIEFEGQDCVSFQVMDRECDRCLTGNCLECEEVGKPWKEYYQFIKYNLRSTNEDVTYEKDSTEAIRMLADMLNEYLAQKERERNLA